MARFGFVNSCGARWSYLLSEKRLCQQSSCSVVPSPSESAMSVCPSFQYYSQTANSSGLDYPEPDTGTKALTRKGLNLSSMEALNQLVVIACDHNDKTIALWRPFTCSRAKITTKTPTRTDFTSKRGDGCRQAPCSIVRQLVLHRHKVPPFVLKYMMKSL